MERLPIFQPRETSSDGPTAAAVIPGGLSEAELVKLESSDSSCSFVTSSGESAPPDSSVGSSGSSGESI
ncbi:MAG: hypothetical protein ACLFP2_05390 [Candidatus Woesearchaeota archaeon]